MLVLDFMVNYKLKIFNGIPVKSMECLDENMWGKRTKDTPAVDPHVSGQPNCYQCNITLLLVLWIWWW